MKHVENHCPTCKGTSKQEINVSYYGTPGFKISVMDCFKCDGGKSPLSEMQSKQLLKAQEEQNKLWCKCENVSSDVTFVPDGKSKACKKHHWVCNHCKKIVQVG